MQRYCFRDGIQVPIAGAEPGKTVRGPARPHKAQLGGISGGLRSVQMAKQIPTALKVMPIPEAVAERATATDEGHCQPAGA
jgi:hypothetical protein